MSLQHQNLANDLMLGMSKVVSITVYVDDIIILIGIFDESSHQTHHKTCDHMMLFG